MPTLDPGQHHGLEHDLLCSPVKGAYLCSVVHRLMQEMGLLLPGLAARAPPAQTAGRPWCPEPRESPGALLGWLSAPCRSRGHSSLYTKLLPQYQALATAAAAHEICA